MCKIEIEKKNVEAAYKVADENGKKLLDDVLNKIREIAPDIAILEV